MTTTQDFVTELLSPNARLCNELISADNDSPLCQGASMMARNRVLIGLSNPRGLESLAYSDDDSVDNVKARIRAIGEWLIRVADQGE